MSEWEDQQDRERRKLFFAQLRKAHCKALNGIMLEYIKVVDDDLAWRRPMLAKSMSWAVIFLVFAAAYAMDRRPDFFGVHWVSIMWVFNAVIHVWTALRMRRGILKDFRDLDAFVQKIEEAKKAA